MNGITKHEELNLFFQGYLDSVFLFCECFAPDLMDILCSIEKTVIMCDPMQ